MNKALALTLLSSTLVYAASASAQESQISWLRTVQRRVQLSHVVETACSSTELKLLSNGHEVTSANWPEELPAGSRIDVAYLIDDSCTEGTRRIERISGHIITADVQQSLNSGEITLDITDARWVRCDRAPGATQRCVNGTSTISISFQYQGTGKLESQSYTQHYTLEDGTKVLHQNSSRQRAANIQFSGEIGDYQVEGTSNQGQLAEIRDTEIHFQL